MKLPATYQYFDLFQLVLVVQGQGSFNLQNGLNRNSFLRFSCTSKSIDCAVPVELHTDHPYNREAKYPVLNCAHLIRKPLNYLAGDDVEVPRGGVLEHHPSLVPIGPHQYFVCG